MTQNSSDSQTLKHLYKGESFDHEYRSGDFRIFILGDAKNNIYRTRFECPGDFRGLFEEISNFIQDKNLDDLIENLARTFESNTNKNNLKLHVALLHFKEALYLYRGDLRTQSTLNSDELLCRCMGVDKRKFSEKFDEVNGEKKKFLTTTNMSLICGSCSQLLKSEFEKLSSSSELYEGKTTLVWKKEIEESLGAFHKYSSSEFEGFRASISYIELPLIHLDISGLAVNIEEERVRNVLTNYLAKEFGLPLEVKIVLNN